MHGADVCIMSGSTYCGEGGHHVSWQCKPNWNVDASCASISCYGGNFQDKSLGWGMEAGSFPKVGCGSAWAQPRAARGPWTQSQPGMWEQGPVVEERFISVRQVHQMSGLWSRQEGSMAEESFAVVIYLPANPKATSDEPVDSPHCSSGRHW